jgi:MoxR-like ATPase
MESSFDASLPDSRLDAEHLYDLADDIREEIGRILVGQTEMVDLFLTALLADGHVLIEGVPGVAKTLTARLVARTLSVDFTRIQFTPDLMPSDVLGTSVFNPKTTEFSFRQGPVFSNVVLIDEINRAPAKTQAALFEVMEERQVSTDGETFPLPPPFVVFATQNPLEHEGTYRLPEAQLDRFLFKIDVGYPSLEEEVEILNGHHAGRNASAIDDVKPVLNAETLNELRALVRTIHVEPDLMRYMAQITHATREHRMLSLGASPRASVAMLNAAKANAALRGRDFVTPDDVQTVAAPVLRHRLMLTPEQEMEGRSTDEAVRRVLADVDVPR